jgi:hypothetical protein
VSEPQGNRGLTCSAGKKRVPWRFWTVMNVMRGLYGALLAVKRAQACGARAAKGGRTQKVESTGLCRLRQYAEVGDGCQVTVLCAAARPPATHVLNGLELRVDALLELPLGHPVAGRQGSRQHGSAVRVQLQGGGTWEQGSRTGQQYVCNAGRQFVGAGQQHE